MNAWKNGNFCNLEDLSVSILDLGLIHSDATYDVFSVQQGYAIGLDYHIDRFFKSCDIWRLCLPYSKEEVTNVAIACAKSLNVDAFVWVVVTRGIPVTGNPRDLTGCSPNVLVYAKPYYGFGQQSTISLWLAESVERTPNSSINQIGKNFSWNDLTKAQWEAFDNNFDSAVLTNNGLVTEGPGFNVGIIKDSKIITPSTNCLPGITMQILELMCNDIGLQFERCDITVDMFLSADEIFVASTAGDITPVTKINSIQKPTVITSKLLENFNLYKLNDKVSRKIY